MNNTAKCFFVYEPITGNFQRINFAVRSTNGTNEFEDKHQRKLTEWDESPFEEGLGTMEFEPITIQPTL